MFDVDKALNELREPEKAEKHGFFRKLFHHEFLPFLMGGVKQLLENGLQRIEEHLERLVDYALRKLSAIVMILIGAVFVLVGAAVLLESTISIPPGSGFIIVGVIVAFAGISLNVRAKR
jgi:hypothetical protein